MKTAILMIIAVLCIGVSVGVIFLPDAYFTTRFPFLIFGKGVRSKSEKGVVRNLIFVLLILAIAALVAFVIAE